MLPACRCNPVRPLCPALKLPSEVLGLGQSGEAVVEVEDLVREGDVAWGEPIVGARPAVLHETEAKPIKSPKEMSPEDFARHCVTHIPFSDACWYCLCAKKSNLPHHRSPGGRTIPLVVADYGFLTMESTQETVPYLVVQVRPWRIMFATVVDVKGVDTHTHTPCSQTSPT